MARYRMVTPEKIQEVLDSETVVELGIFFPLHKGEQFIAQDGEAWILCDNRDGYAWTDDFPTKGAAVYAATH